MIPTEFTTFLGHSNSTSHGNVSGLQMIFQLKMVIFHRFKQIIIIHPNCWLYIPHYHIIFPLYSHYIPIIFPLFSPFLVGSTTRLSTYKLEITKQNSGLFFRHRSPSKKSLKFALQIGKLNAEARQESDQWAIPRLPRQKPWMKSTLRYDNVCPCMPHMFYTYEYL